MAIPYTISTRKNLEADEETQREAFGSLLSAYQHDGHIFGREWHSISSKSHFEAHVLAPASDTFEARYRNEWISKALETLRSLGLSEPEYSKIEDRSGQEGCACDKPKSLILFTTYLSLETPLVCGDCYRTAPLYRFPRMANDEFFEVTTWADDYKACDMLFMHSGTGERFGYRETSQVGSSLSHRGREICGHFERNTGMPVHYFLSRYYGRSWVSERARKCPGCGGGWLLEHRWHDFFDFRCEACRLVSILASQVT